MPDLVLRPSKVKPGKPWALQMRWHESVGEVEYCTLALVTDAMAHEIIAAGATSWLLGEPKPAVSSSLSLQREEKS